MKQKQARKDYTNDQVQAAKSRVENLEILPSAHAHDRLKVRDVSIIWQKQSKNFLCPEVRERRVAHQRHQMSSERGYKIYK